MASNSKPVRRIQCHVKEGLHKDVVQGLSYLSDGYVRVQAFKSKINAMLMFDV